MTQLSKQEAARLIADQSLAISILVGKRTGQTLNKRETILVSDFAGMLRKMAEHEELILSANDSDSWAAILSVWHKWPELAKNQLVDFGSSLLSTMEMTGQELVLITASILEDLAQWSWNYGPEPSFAELDLARDFLWAFHNVTSLEVIAESS